MARNELITGLDIGSHAIRLVAAQRVSDQKEQGIQMIGAIEVPAQGVSRGVITNIEDAVSALSGAFERMERVIGVPIEHVWVGLSGVQLKTQVSNGIVAVSKPNGEISEEDVARVIEAVQTIANPPNYELIHVLPRHFTVDGQGGITDPIGMTAIRLEVEARIILALGAQVKNLTKAIYRTGVEIDEVVLSIVAAAEGVLTPRQRELGVALVDIGAATTSMIVFEENQVLHVGMLPIGADHITADVAIGLRTELDVAEEVKLGIDSCIAKEVKKEDFNLAAYGGEETLVGKRYVAEIIEARTEEILDKIQDELKKVGRNGMLPAGVIFVGGGAKLPGLIDLARHRLSLPASLGKVRAVGHIDHIHDLGFATATGLVLWADRVTREPHARGRRKSFLPGVDEFGRRMQKWMKSLLP